MKSRMRPVLHTSSDIQGAATTTPQRTSKLLGTSPHITFGSSATARAFARIGQDALGCPVSAAKTRAEAPKQYLGGVAGCIEWRWVGNCYPGLRTPTTFR